MLEETAGETGIRRAFNLLTSLIPSTFSTRSFPAKWQVIRDKLEQLISILRSRLSDPDDNQAIAELIQAVTVASEEIQLLAHRCSDAVYTGGKLLIRSDLDVIAGKLELLIKRTSVVSGTSTNSRAIILSRPRVGASREEMRFYVKDIFSRLRVGDWEIRARSLAALNEIFGEDDKYVRIAAAETDNGISILVSFLEFSEIGSIQDDAAEAVKVIAGFDCYNAELAAAGAISQLVRVLETGSKTARERAARALKHLTENSENAWSVSSHGGVTVLLKVCGDSASSEELVGSACSILRSLSGVREIKKFMLEQGIVSALNQLSQSNHELIQIRAIEFLNSFMSSEDSSVKLTALKDGTLDSLMKVLNPDSPSSSKARELALRAVDGLCFDSPSASSMSILIGSGFLHRLLFYVKNGEISVQESAMKAVSRFCDVSEDAKKAMGNVGFMQEMVQLLDARSFEVREMAARALCSMVSVQRNRRMFIGEDNGVNRILQLLDPEEQQKSTVTKKSLLSVLMNLADSSSGRRKLAASGYVKNLEKLAEIDMVEAKMIVKKISSSKLKTMLNGIWRSYHKYHQ